MYIDQLFLVLNEKVSCSKYVWSQYNFFYAVIKLVRRQGGGGFQMPEPPPPAQSPAMHRYLLILGSFLSMSGRCKVTRIYPSPMNALIECPCLIHLTLHNTKIHTTKVCITLSSNCFLLFVIILIEFHLYYMLVYKLSCL